MRTKHLKTVVTALLLYFQGSFLMGQPGTFLDSGQMLTSGNGASTDVELGDLDGDGDQDAFVVKAGAPSEIWFNNGSGYFSNSNQSLSGSTNNGYSSGIGDLDGDGDLDLILGEWPGSNRVFLNNGAGTFSATAQNFGTRSTGGIAVGDLDGDGDLDFFAAHEGSNNEIWMNNGSAAFTLAQQIPGPGGTWADIGDIDNDNDLDLVASDRNGTQVVYQNNGSGNFTLTQSIQVSTSVGSIELADLDGDGRPGYGHGLFSDQSNADLYEQWIWYLFLCQYQFTRRSIHHR